MYRGQQLISLSDASRDDLEALVTNLVETGAVSAETVKSQLDQIRAKTGERLIAASKVESPVEQAEQLLVNLANQYIAMRATLNRYEISTEGMGTWKLIKNSLTPEVLVQALKLAEPTLLVVPPTTTQSKIEAIDKHPAEGQKYATECRLDEPWTRRKSNIVKNWRVFIVEGVQNVDEDLSIYDGIKTNQQMVKEWLAMRKAQGLDVLDDVDAYLILMMKALAEGKPVDTDNATVLNAKSLTESTFLLTGRWDVNCVNLGYDESDDCDPCLCLRDSIEVDVPQVIDTVSAKP